MFILSSNTFCNSVQKDCESQQDNEHFGIIYLTLLDMLINNIYSVLAMSSKERNKIHSSFSSFISANSSCLACRFVSSIKERNTNQFPLAHFSHYQYGLYCITEDLDHVISKNLLFCKYMEKMGDFTMLVRNDARIFNIQLGLGLRILA